MKQPRILFGTLCLLGAAFLVVGCASGGAKVCRPGALTRPEMQLDNQAHDRAIDDHVYFSKEAASGGRGFGGGGCGCN